MSKLDEVNKNFKDKLNNDYNKLDKLLNTLKKAKKKYPKSFGEGSKDKNIINFPDIIKKLMDLTTKYNVQEIKNFKNTIETYVSEYYKNDKKKH